MTKHVYDETEKVSRGRTTGSCLPIHAHVVHPSPRSIHRQPHLARARQQPPQRRALFVCSKLVAGGSALLLSTEQRTIANGASC